MGQQRTEPETAAPGTGGAEANPLLVRLAVRRLDREVLGGADSLGEAVQARARRFHREVDRRRFLAGRVIARTLVADLLQVPEATVTATASCPDPNCRYGNDGGHGEPRYFQNGQPAPLHVSFSRCGDWLAAAAAGIRRGDGPGVDRIGVDLDNAAAPAFAGSDVEDVMAADAERSAIAAVAAAGRPRLRAQLWVRKEAALKAGGQGLRTDPRSVDTLSGQHSGVRIYDVGPEKLGLPANFVLALATDAGSVRGRSGALRLELSRGAGQLPPDSVLPAWISFCGAPAS